MLAWREVSPGRPEVAAGRGVAQADCSCPGLADGLQHPGGSRAEGTRQHPENIVLGETLVSLSSSATKTRAGTERVAPGQALGSVCC